jgi:multiple sugar transport system permease protein
MSSVKVSPALPPGMGKKQKKFISSLKNNLVAWMIAFPSVVLFIYFVWFPIIQGGYLSFFHTVGFKTKEFIGLKNYVDVINAADFNKAVANTLVYVFWSFVLGYFVPIVVAIMINEMVHFKSLIRFSVYFPVITPGLAAVLIWGVLYSPGEGGLLNAILASLHLPMSQWLSDPTLTIPLIVVTMVWKSFGATVIIYLASLQNISQELYEASTLDGASIWNRLRHITVPQIYNVASICFILQFIGVFQLFYEPLTMTGGGPINASVTLMLLNYRYAFEKYEMGRAVAIGMIVFVILVTFSIIYFKFNKEKETE